MTLTLDIARQRVRQIATDNNNTPLDQGDIDVGIRQAVAVYSSTRPLEAIGVITLPSDGREVSLSSLTGLLNINRIWLPYTVATPEHPPRWRTFEHWQDAALVYFPDEGEPSTDDVARVFYTKLQTLNGLDSATATTIFADDEFLLVGGATGYAVRSYARRFTGKSEQSINEQVSVQILRWASIAIREFEVALGIAVNEITGLRVDNAGQVEVRQLTRRQYFNRTYPAQQKQIGT